MAEREKTELTIRSTMTASSMLPTVTTSIRNERSRTSTGTAIRDIAFQRIRLRKTRSLIPSSRSSKLFTPNVMTISVKHSMSETVRPDTLAVTDQRRICGKTRKPVRKNRLSRSGRWRSQSLKSVSPAVLAEIAAEFFEEFDRRFGKHIHILDWALHLDEATPHIHERHVFDCENRYGEIAPQQEKALEALGFERPHPDQKASKLNSRKITFDAACRVMLFDICERHGLHLDREPEYGGRAYLEKQDYILMKQKEKMTVQDQQIESKEAELEAITIRIEDTEAFVEEVADAAYEQAVDVVTKTVQEEIRNEDFDLIEEHRRIILNNVELSDRERNFAHRIFAGLMNRFKGMTQHISERMAAIFRSPEKKAEIKEPIKESIRDRLARNQKRADELNARRRTERGIPPKRKQRNIEL